MRTKIMEMTLRQESRRKRKVLKHLQYLLIGVEVEFLRARHLSPSP